MRIIIACFCLVLSSSLFAQHHIIPAPVEYTKASGVFLLSANTPVYLDTNQEASRIHVERFLEELKIHGYQSNLKIGTPAMGERAIAIKLNPKANSIIGTEGYSLEVNSSTIAMEANNPAGVLYGLQTLRQLFPLEFFKSSKASPKNLNIAACKIIDYPRFGWRGLMLDVSRHFFTIAEVKEYIDVMQEYKLNTFHWHLVDDNGWRIEIKSMPKLTEVGAWRVERFGRFGDRKDPQPGEATPYGGFYTQQQIKDVIQYAADRNIKVVPEIDVPGHSMALLAAYPELSCKKESKMVNPGTKFAEWYGNHEFKMLIENTIDPSNEEVYKALDKIFGEIADLFPAEFIHMGGDEAYHGYWMDDPDCQALMKKEGISNGDELQSYFVKRVGKIINSHGKKMIGWDEILEGGLAEGSAVMSWRGIKGGVAAAKAGHQVVMTPTTHVYLDYSQGDHTLEIPIYADLFLSKTYSFEPVPEGVDSKYILGAQGNLWSEQIPTLDHALYQTYPRANAIAELTWSPKEKKDWGNFMERMEYHFDLFEALDRPICKAVYDPKIKAKMKGEKLMISLSSEVDQTEFYYTIDHTFPNHRTPKYTGAFEVPEGHNVALKVVAYRKGEQIGRMTTVHRDELLKRAGRVRDSSDD